MILLRLSLTLLLCTILPHVGAQDRTPSGDTATVPNPLADRMAIVLQRSSDGHSPTPDDISALTAQTSPPTPADLRKAIPLIEKALENPDGPVRTYALTALVSLQSQQPAKSQIATPATAPADPNAPAQPESKPAPPTGPSHLQARPAKLLTPKSPKSPRTSPRSSSPTASSPPPSSAASLRTHPPPSTLRSSTTSNATTPSAPSARPSSKTSSN